MNDGQKSLIRNWRVTARQFLTREWNAILVGSAIGVASAALERLVFQDAKFKGYLAANYLPPSSRFDDIRLYSPYLWASLILVGIFLVTSGPKLLLRGIRSWLAGCTSGIPLLFALSMFFTLVRSSGAASSRITQLGAADLGFFSLSFGLFLARRVAEAREMSQQDMLVHPALRAVAGTSFQNLTNQSIHGKKMHSDEQRSWISLRERH
jgi:hypothetical protein